jgi:hypothetical protein
VHSAHAICGHVPATGSWRRISFACGVARSLAEHKDDAKRVYKAAAALELSDFAADARIQVSTLHEEGGGTQAQGASDEDFALESVSRFVQGVCLCRSGDGAWDAGQYRELECGVLRARPCLTLLL